MRRSPHQKHRFQKLERRSRGLLRRIESLYCSYMNNICIRHLWQYCVLITASVLVTCTKRLLTRKYCVLLFLHFLVVNSIIMVRSLNSLRAPQINTAPFVWPENACQAQHGFEHKKEDLKLALPMVLFSWKPRGTCCPFLSCRVLNRLSLWQYDPSVCLCIHGIWYCETAATDFDDLISLLFHVWSCAVLGVYFELVALKDNIINYLLQSEEIGAP